MYLYICAFKDHSLPYTHTNPNCYVTAYGHIWTQLKSTKQKLWI